MRQQPLLADLLLDTSDVSFDQMRGMDEWVARGSLGPLQAALRPGHGIGIWGFVYVDDHVRKAVAYWAEAYRNIPEAELAC